MAPSVFVLLHRAADEQAATTVLSVFLDLADANTQCLIHAKEAKVEPKPVVGRPLSWEAPDGEACWVEKHHVTPKTSLAIPRPATLERKNSRLYDSEEDDAIEVQDADGHYD
ncbi:Fc.00g097090.m01.CDS01 [Cosmosporella sp. VM-42]